MKWLFVFLALTIGLLAVIKAFWIVKTFGQLRWAEQRLGPGGSYLAWKMIGIVLILSSWFAWRLL